MNRSLSELQLRVGVLLQVSDVLRKETVGIAREKSPSGAYDLACIAARQHGYAGMEIIGIAKATRWLSVIRRDHGEAVFNEAVARLTTPTV